MQTIGIGKRSDSVRNKNVSKRAESTENSVIKSFSIKLCSSFKKKTTESSNVWHHYGKMLAEDGNCIDEENYYCNPCLQREQKNFELRKGAHLSKIHKVKVSTSSGNLKNHLFLVHQIDCDKTENQTKSNNTLKNWCTGETASSSKFDITRDIALWFSVDLLPFNIVGKEGFVKFFTKNLGIVPPSPSSLTHGALIDMYKAIKRSVTECLSDISCASLLFDGWTDKYKKLSYMGVKCSIIDSQWERKIFTLVCAPLDSHTAENTADFIKEIVLDMFGKRYRDLKLHNVHDGAANMMRTSRLLGCEQPQHCLAHVLNLLLVTDGLSKCSEIQELLEKCRKIVTCLSFKSASLMNEALRNREDVDVYNKLRKMAEVKEIDNLEDQFPAPTPCDDDDGEDREANNDHVPELFAGVLNKHSHRSLKQQVVTRWNSTLFMTESIAQLYDSTDNLLKKIGRRDLCLDEVDIQLLYQLVKFLKPFEALTEIVSASSNSIAILPLVKHKITTLLVHTADDLPEIKKLKVSCGAKLQSRFTLSNSAQLSCLLDPAVKNIFPNEEAIQTLLQRASSIQLANGNDNVHKKQSEGIQGNGNLFNNATVVILYHLYVLIIAKFLVIQLPHLPE